jgi:hypothetical protein
MSLHIPPDLATLLRRDTGESVLQHQLTAEAAANLGRLGRQVQARLGELRAMGHDVGAARREALLYACADAVWCYFVQREACGLANHDPVIEAYAIPREVLAKVGAAPPPADERR